MSEERFTELVELHIDGGLTDAEAGELSAILAADPAARARMRGLLRDHVLVRAAVRMGDPAERARRASLLVAAHRPTSRHRAANRVLLRWDRSRPRRWRWLAVAALLALTVGLPWWAVAHLPRPPAGMPAVADRQGQVSTAGSDLVTGTDGRVALLWTDGTRIELEPDTRLLRADGISLVEGRIRAMVAPQRPGTAFVITTPDARIAVLGTSFRVRVDGSGTRLEVRDGTVDFTPAAGGTTVRVGPGQVAVAARRAAEGRLLVTATRLAAIRRAIASGDGLWAPLADRLAVRLPTLIARPIVLPQRWSVPNWHLPDRRERHEAVRREISSAVLATWELALAARLDLHPAARQQAAAWLAAWCRPGVGIVDEAGDPAVPEVFAGAGVICFDLPLLIQAADLLRGTPELDPVLEADLDRWFTATIAPAADAVARPGRSFNRSWGVLARMMLAAWAGHRDEVRSEMRHLCAELPDLLSSEALARSLAGTDDVLGRCLAGVLIAADLERAQNGSVSAPPDAWFTACRTWREHQRNAGPPQTPVAGLLLGMSGPGPWCLPDQSLVLVPEQGVVSWQLVLGRADGVGR